APPLPKPHYPLLRTNPSTTALSLSLFVGEELAPPVASTLSSSTTFAKEHLSLALLAPPVAPNTVTLTTIATGQ
ncbi:hypothetical protein PZH37_15545, partial [[Eubacterium] siraeum]|nr:hypothetical protein [[Eubacterium] siraeum]